jgi:hypothetical protein
MATSATCAVCSQPIVKGDPFVLVGTEGMHRRCALLAGHSVLRRTRAEVERLRRELENSQRDLSVTRNDLDNARHSLRSEISERTRAMEREHRAKERAHRAEQLAEHQDRDHARELARMAGNVREALRERDVARNEAALHQTIQGQPVDVQGRTSSAMTSAQPAALPAQDLPSSQNEDTSAIRFSLLELDK